MEHRGKFGKKRGRPPKAAYERFKKNVTYNADALLQMREESIETVDPDRLEHLERVTLSESADDAVWLKSFISQTGTPFFVKIGGVVTQIFH
jgi:hypothetical protein